MDLGFTVISSFSIFPCALIILDTHVYVQSPVANLRNGHTVEGSCGAGLPSPPPSPIRLSSFVVDSVKRGCLQSNWSRCTACAADSAFYSL